MADNIENGIDCSYVYSSVLQNDYQANLQLQQRMQAITDIFKVSTSDGKNKQSSMHTCSSWYIQRGDNPVSSIGLSRRDILCNTFSLVFLL
jgi:hypothetical protein